MNEDLKYIKTETETQICKKLDDMENVSEIAINYDEVRLKAKVKPISNVLVQSLDEYTKELYYIMLAYSLKDCKNDVVEKLTMLQRLAMGAKLNMTLEDLEKKSYTVNSATVDELIKSANSNHFGEYFLIDLLLVNAVCGKIEKKALDYIAYIAAFLGIGKNTVQAISMFVKNVIERNQKGCISSLKDTDIDLNMLKDYLPKTIDGYILKNIYENNSKQIEKVYIINQVFKSDKIDITSIFGEDITFLNCIFDNSNITGGKGKVKFEDCRFVNMISKHRSYKVWIYCCAKYSEFENCEFENCELKGENIGPLLWITGKKTALKNCVFRNINVDDTKRDSYSTLYDSYAVYLVSNEVYVDNIQFYEVSVHGSGYNTNRSYIVYASNAVIKNLYFEKCSSSCSVSYYERCRHINSICLKLRNSVLSDSFFKKCGCYSSSGGGPCDEYIVEYDKSCTVKNLKFESCRGNDYREES